jgi:Glycosyl transferases group 1
MGAAEPFVVLCWENIPGHIPPFRISPRQVTIGVCQRDVFNVAGCLTEMPQVMLPAGVYDLDLVLRQAGFVEVPDLIVVWTSAFGVNLPSNLSAFRCPKLLICSDTHHMRQPIRRLIDYARAEAFDAVASAYDRHHLHWFLAAGFGNSAWLPGITVQHVMPPWQTQRSDRVVFIGQMGELHGWRGALLERIVAAEIPLLSGLATRARSAEEYATSIITFNGSLNGDLNMRVFEVLSAGGFLLTDRLSPQAGLELLLRPGHDCETYGDADELLDKIAFYRRSPAAALRIAEQGAATYRREHLAEHRITVLRDWMLDGVLPDRFNPRHDLRLATSQAAVGQLDSRLAIYEIVQESQRAQSGLSVLVSPGWSVASVMDLADLMRTRVTVIEPAPDFVRRRRRQACWTNWRSLMLMRRPCRTGTSF